MKSASAATIALLAGNQCYYAELYTITLNSGAILYYTDGDGPLVYGGNTFICNAPLVSRDRTKLVVGVQADSVNVTMQVSPANLISGIPFSQFAVNGGFDGATMKIDRCYMATYGDTSAGIVNIFTGMVIDVAPSRTEIVLQVGSNLQLLNIAMPRNVFSPGCSHSVYDTGCGAIKASFGAAGSATSGSTISVINCGLTQASGWFDNGTITFGSGANAGVQRTIKSYTTGVITLALPLAVAPTIGDTFTAYAGCDKSKDTCISKFNRLVSFRGFPYVPIPESSI
jgi:uncharacterized phage protein (TIGR02218 family)